MSAAIVLHAEAPLVDEAERILDGAQLPHERVIAVDHDSILYENKMHKARTAWLEREDGTGRMKVRMVIGFPIEPPPDRREP